MSKEETRKKILKAAEALFSKNGYDGVATKRIAKEAGITEMTLFNHFPHKKLLYKTIVTERYSEVEVRSVFPQLTYDNLERDLHTIAEKLIDHYFKNKNIMMMRLKEKESFQDDDRFTIERDPFLDQILPVFQAYQDKGLIRGEADKSLLLFIAAIKGLFYVCLQDDKNKAAVGKLVRDYVSVFCKGIEVK